MLIPSTAYPGFRTSWKMCLLQNARIGKILNIKILCKTQWLISKMPNSIWKCKNIWDLQASEGSWWSRILDYHWFQDLPFFSGKEIFVILCSIYEFKRARITPSLCCGHAYQLTLLSSCGPHFVENQGSCQECKTIVLLFLDTLRSINTFIIH